MSVVRPFAIHEIPKGDIRSLKEIEIQLAIIKPNSDDGIRIGSTIKTSKELDEQIDYLIMNLEAIRAEGKMLLSSQEIKM